MFSKFVVKATLIRLFVFVQNDRVCECMWVLLVKKNKKTLQMVSGSGSNLQVFYLLKRTATTSMCLKGDPPPQQCEHHHTRP